LLQGVFTGTENCNLYLRSNLRIVSNSATIDCQKLYPAIVSVNLTNVSLENLVIQNALSSQGGAAMFLKNSVVNFTGCTFQDNTANGGSVAGGNMPTLKNKF
jgi:hypothetical protein